MRFLWGKKSTRKNDRIATRKLRLESLENRELLDASGIIYVNTNIDNSVNYKAALSDFTILENGSPDYDGDGYTSLREALVYCKAKNAADKAVTNLKIVFEPSDKGFNGIVDGVDTNRILLTAGLATTDLLYGIDGSMIEGGVTIDGDGRFIGLNLAANYGNLDGYNNITSLNFKNCAYVSTQTDALYGGPIRVSTSATFTDCTFTNCFTNSNAGALYVLGGDVVLNDCAFDSCYTSAENTNASVGYGGAIAVKSSTNTVKSSLVVNNSTFTNCHAPNGGAIAVQTNGSSQPTELTIVDSVFENNYSNTILSSTVTVQAGQGGGAIWTAGTTLIKGDTRFENNASNTNGGAICVSQGYLSIVGTKANPIEFTGNKVFASNYNIETGGTIARTQSALDTAAKTSGGGAIAIAKLSSENRYYDENGNAVYAPVAYNAAFTNNSSVLNGGTLCVANTSTYDAVFENTTIESSSAQRFGGAIFNAGKVSLIESSAIRNSSALLGGAYYGYGTFTALGGGDLIYFDNNFAYSDANGKYGSGGAFYNTTTKAYTGVLSFNYVQIHNNNAEKHGGAIANFGVATVLAADVKYNKAEKGYGGAIQNAGTIETINSGYAFNKAYNGGAIYSSNNKTNQNQGSFHITGMLYFEENEAANAGGAIDVVSGTLSFVSPDGSCGAGAVQFVKNNAKNIGGAIAVAGDVVFPNDWISFEFTDNAAGFGPTIAASCYTTSDEAEAMKAGFNFDPYAETDQFVTFVKTVSSATMELTYDYLKQLLDAADENAKLYYKIGENGAYQQLEKGQAIDVSERATIYYYAVDSNGEKSYVCKLLADPQAGSSLAATARSPRK